MATKYPNDIDSYTTKQDGIDSVMASHINDLQDAVVAIETELGPDSSSIRIRKSQITDFPSSMPANGGNADTIDGKHASDFAPTGHEHDISSTITGNLLTSRLSEPNYRTGSITPTARPLFDVLRADRTAFLPESQIIIEQSTDAGVTWEDAQVADSTKRKLFTGQRPSITIPLKNGVKSTDCMLRVTITGMRYDVPAGTAETKRYDYWNSSYILSTERYFAAQEGWIWVNSNSDRIHLKAERATGANPNTWKLDREAYLSGWSGGNYFSLSASTFGGGKSQTSNYWNWRFTFRTCSAKNTFNDADLSINYPSSAQSIYHIKIGGRNIWTYSNNYMYHDHLYNWDEYENAIFPAEIKANTFKNSSGTEVAYTTDIPAKLSHLTKDINFDERYYTETEMDSKLADKAPISHVGATGSAHGVATTSVAGFMSTDDKSKLNGIAVGANKYVHPSAHLASIITESTTRRFVSDSEKSTWNAKETTSGAQARVDAHANKADNPHGVTKSQVGLGSVANYGIATQSEAEAGTSNSKYMTPLRVKEAVETLAGSGGPEWADIGDTVILQYLPEIRGNSTSETSVVGFQLTKPGRYRITGEMNGNVWGGESNFNLYVKTNTGILIKYFSVYNPGWVSFSVDSDILSPGTLIKITGNNYSGTSEHAVRNLQIRCNFVPEPTPTVFRY